MALQYLGNTQWDASPSLLYSRARKCTNTVLLNKRVFKLKIFVLQDNPFFIVWLIQHRVSPTYLFHLIMHV